MQRLAGRLEFRRQPGDPWDLAYVRIGTRDEVLASARELLIDLREEGHPKAAVRVATGLGRLQTVRAPKAKEG